MRVLFVPGTGVRPESGGQGSFCRYLVEGLLELGHESEIAGSEDWAAFCKTRGIRLRPDVSPRFGRVDIVHVSGPGLSATVRGLLSYGKVLLTHHDYRAICPALIAWAPRGCQIVGMRDVCRDCPDRRCSSRMRLRVLQLTLRFCRNVAVSEFLLQRLALPKSDAILNPMRAEPSSSPEDPNLLAFAGRLVPEKGVPVLLHAVSKIAATRLHIAGDGPMLPMLKRLADDLGVAERVRFLGQVGVDHVRQLYHRAAVICVPSIWDEPFGYAAAEALAIGRALITSDRGALPELAGEDRGWICDSDDPSVWAATIESVLSDDHERLRRSRNAIRFVTEELSPYRVAERYAHVYEKVLAENGS